MIKIHDKSNCCGCTACACICPKNAITMEADVLGFKYPHVDLTLCIDCGLCEKICPFINKYNITHNLSSPIFYAARHKNIKEVETSRSGAAFIAISDYILDRHGVVYGAGYDNNFNVIHKRAITREERDEFKGSKYVQSDLHDIFTNIKKDLIEGKLVLFSGTPCQTAGLSSFISQKLRNQLILVDIICHGVPAPNIWRDYIKYIENKFNKKIHSIDFRDKKHFGWNEHKETFYFGDTYFSSDVYKNLFLKNIMLRKSCGICPYSNFNRPSDITIGDFWGWERSVPEINKDNKGVSLIIVNTKLGKQIFESIKSNLIFVEINKNDCIQPNLVHPSTIDKRRDQFEKDYKLKGFSYIIKHYCSRNRTLMLSIMKRQLLKLKEILKWGKK